MLMRMAGRFSRRVRGWAKKRNIPVIDTKTHERKHDLAQEYMPSDPNFEGIFAVIVGRMSAPVWQVLRFPGGTFHLRRKTPMPFVNHYYFHILDRHWGHVTIAMSGHPPFRAMVMLNGHEYVACRARQAGIAFVKEDNCFVEMSDSRKLAEVADALRSKTAIGQLRHVCERWIYRCLCFGLSFEEQKRSRFRYDYSVFQMEYSRNLLFRRPRQMERVFDGVIDRTRSSLDIKQVLKIFGRKYRHSRRNGTVPREQVVLETPVYDLTVFKVHFGRLTLKLYTKGESVLRSEAIAHCIDSLNCGRVLEKFGLMIESLLALLNRFLDTMRCVDMPWVWEAQLDDLPSAGMVGQTRVGGVDVNRPRMRTAMEAAIALSPKPDGFTVADHAAKVRELIGYQAAQYTARQSAYDLKKLRGKRLVEKTRPTARSYRPTQDGLRTMTGLIVLREKVLRPLLAQMGRCQSGPPPQMARIDACYRQIQHAMQSLFRELHFVQLDVTNNILRM
jgi:hypothetical protein